jgi:hypothetical protein
VSAALVQKEAGCCRGGEHATVAMSYGEILVSEISRWIPAVLSAHWTETVCGVGDDTGLVAHIEIFRNLVDLKSADAKGVAPVTYTIANCAARSDGVKAKVPVAIVRKRKRWWVTRCAWNVGGPPLGLLTTRRLEDCLDLVGS